MNTQFEIDKEDALRRERWERRIAEMKRQKEKRLWWNRNLKKVIAITGAFLCISIVGIIIGLSGSRGEDEEESTVSVMAQGMEDAEEDLDQEQIQDAVQPLPPVVEEVPSEPQPVQVGDVVFVPGYEAEATEATIVVGNGDIVSEYAILMNPSDGTIVAQKDAYTIINPASMTKVLTVLVAAEHVTNLDDTFTMTLDITDYAYVNDCSSIGFLKDEVVTVRDLFYGTILPSGGEAAVALATYVAGSHEAFVELMNDKLVELGLSDTAHFTNCVGIYNKEHYCTVYDMAMIMKAALENEFCREVLTTRIYTTTPTSQHPDGITTSNWFIRRIEDKETGGKVLGAKTGYVNQSGNCAVSYAISEAGVPYICVTAKSSSSWKCIYDHVALYSKYGK